MNNSLIKYIRFGRFVTGGSTSILESEDFNLISLYPSTAHIKYSSVMLALYIYIVLNGNKKQNFDNFFCVGLSDNPIWINGLITILCRIGLVKCNKQ